MSIKLEDALEASLQRLQAGENLEEVLSAYSEHAAELKPLLMTAQAAVDLAADVHASPVAQNRSRGQFLSAAAVTIPTPHRRQHSFFHFRLAAASLIIAGILALGLLGTGLVSASALPGDALYPVKRMVETIQINLAPDPSSRLELEENLDDRRLAEVTRLSEINRREFVTFSGVLSLSADNIWTVGNLVLNFPSGTLPEQMLGRYVQVSGHSDSRQVDVEDIQLRSFIWDGVIQKIESGRWVVSGIELTIDNSTELTGGDPRVGASAHVTAIRLPDDHYLAETILVLNASTATRGVNTQVPSTRTAEPKVEPTDQPTRVEPGDDVIKTEAPEPTHAVTPSPGRTPTRPARATSTPTSDRMESTDRAISPTRQASPSRSPTPTPTATEEHD